MSLDKVLAISGKPGIYELKTQTRAGFLAESLLDGKKISVSIRHNVSILSEIAIYTLSEEVPLRVILQKIKDKENGEPTISHKVSKDLTMMKIVFTQVTLKKLYSGTTFFKKRECWISQIPMQPMKKNSA